MTTITRRSRQLLRALGGTFLLLSVVTLAGCGPSEVGTASGGQEQAELAKKRFDDAKPTKAP